MDVQFKKGDFQSYRATVKFHLGGIEVGGNRGMDVWEHDEVEFDGYTLKVGSDHYNLPTVRAAIKQGWLVPTFDTTSTYRPKPAGVVVHAAQSEGSDRGDKIEMFAVSEEEMVVNTVDTANLGQKRGKIVMEDQEGVPIARISTPAKQTAKVTDSRTAAAEARKLDSTTPKKAQPLERPVVGDELSELLPDAAVAAPPPRKQPSAKKSYYKHVEYDLKTLRGSKGDFQWDLNQHWKTRVKLAVENFAADPKAIASIKAVEMDSVKKRIEKALA